jgi:hypothetical protein
MNNEGNGIPELDGLLYKFTELLTGEADEQRVEMIKAWAIYSHLLKVMPPVVQHWTVEHPEGKLGMRSIFEQIQEWNQANKVKIREQQSKFNDAQNK